MCLGMCLGGGLLGVGLGMGLGGGLLGVGCSGWVARGGLLGAGCKGWVEVCGDVRGGVDGVGVRGGWGGGAEGGARRLKGRVVVAGEAGCG